MVKALPQRFNPDLLARDGTQFESVIPQRQLPRLSALLISAEHDVRTVSRFSRRKDHIVVSGRLDTVYALQCQRCLEPMQVRVNEPYELVFVENEQAAEALPEALDPVVLDENGHIHVVDLFEDELMLHVPGIPRHAAEEPCQIAQTEFGQLPDQAIEEKANPFDALKALKLH